MRGCKYGSCFCLFYLLTFYYGTLVSIWTVLLFLLILVSSSTGPSTTEWMSGPSACTVGTTLDYASGKYTVTPSTAAAFLWVGVSLGHVSHSVFLRCLGLTIAVVLLLAFVERPSSLSLSSDPRRRSTHLNPPCGATESVELLCLIIFCLDLAVKVNSAEWANTVFDYIFSLQYISYVIYWEMYSIF